MDIYIISTLKMSQLWYKAVNKPPNPFSWSVKIQLVVYNSESQLSYN